MADETDKRRLIGIDEDEPLPEFGKRTLRPPVTEEEKQARRLENFRKEARSLLQEGRDRTEEEKKETRAAGRKAGIFSLIRKTPKPASSEPETELTEEEEWHRRMAAGAGPGISEETGEES